VTGIARTTTPLDRGSAMRPRSAYGADCARRQRLSCGRPAAPMREGAVVPVATGVAANGLGPARRRSPWVLVCGSLCRRATARPIGLTIGSPGATAVRCLLREARVPAAPPGVWATQEQKKWLTWWRREARNPAAARCTAEHKPMMARVIFLYHERFSNGSMQALV